MSSAAPAAIASPCGLKMLAVGLEQVGPLHALRARARAYEQRHVAPVERLPRVIGHINSVEQRERAIEQLQRRSLCRLDGIGDLQGASSRTGVSGPSICPEAILNSNA